MFLPLPWSFRHTLPQDLPNCSSHSPPWFPSLFPCQQNLILSITDHFDRSFKSSAVLSQGYHSGSLPTLNICSFLLTLSSLQYNHLDHHPLIKSANCRVKYWHPSQPEYIICFKSKSVRTICSPFRTGAPPAHWHRQRPATKFSSIDPMLSQFKDNSRTQTLLYYQELVYHMHLPQPVGDDGELWQLLSPKLKYRNR